VKKNRQSIERKKRKKKKKTKKTKKSQTNREPSETTLLAHFPLLSLSLALVHIAKGHIENGLESVREQAPALGSPYSGHVGERIGR